MVMRRVLITGAAGFIGRHCLAPLLDRGFEVHALSLANPSGALQGNLRAASGVVTDEFQRDISREFTFQCK